ncbi:MAG: hypothetical protein AAF357_02215 [Verrucomicrobiota bacterium]
MPVVATLAINEDGIAYQWFTEQGRVRHEALAAWTQISEITVFKRDLYAYDLICLRVLLGDGVEIETDEEDVNWNLLVNSLPTFLPGTIEWPSWFSDVAFPAFEACAQTIFSRQMMRSKSRSSSAERTETK